MHKIPGLMNISCTSTLLPLNSNVSVLHAAIDGMVASGYTYIPAGLMWGWRTLSPPAPFSKSIKGGPDPVKQVLVLMTDGANTKSPTYPEHNGTNTSEANDLTSTICKNMKKPSVDIEIYTIAFQVTDATIKNILQTCASKPNFYYNASDNTQLVAAFDDIARSLTTLRLEK